MFRYLLAVIVCTTASASAAEPLRGVADDVNQKLVKLFGSGGFRGIANYATGILVSPDGHILSAATPAIDTPEVIVHLADGRRMTATVLVTEPELDVALLQIKVPDPGTRLQLPYFDVAEAAKRPRAAPGTWVLGFSNQFEIAMRDEAVSVTHGVVSAVGKLHGRRGIFDFPYSGDVYVIDGVTNNPGAGGGALTDRRGNLLGLIGREIKNSLSETWLNYAMPIDARVEVTDGTQVVTVSIPQFVAKGTRGEYKPVARPKQATGPGGYHGIVFLPNLLERTPPYIEDVRAGSPAEKSGLRVNDLVSFVDGEPVNSVAAFYEYMKRTRPGMTVRFEVRRGSKLETVEVTLTEFPKGTK